MTEPLFTLSAFGVCVSFLLYTIYDGQKNGWHNHRKLVAATLAFTLGVYSVALIFGWTTVAALVIFFGTGVAGLALMLLRPKDELLQDLISRLPWPNESDEIALELNMLDASGPLIPSLAARRDRLRVERDRRQRLGE